MTRVPFAVWKPLPEATSQPLMDEVRGLIYHTPVGTMRGTWDYFARESNPIESTFLLGCPLCGADLDGVLWQIMDADRRADANREANRFFGSIEMCDHGDPSRPLSPRQLATAVRLGLWYRSHYGTPPRVCPTPYSPGFGYHSLWLDTSYEYADGSTPWTPSPGKTCPGPVRIRQLRTIVFPAIFAGTQLGGQEDDMTTEEHDALMRIDRRMQEFIVFGTTSVDATMESLFSHLRRIEANSQAALDKDAAILGALTLLPTTHLTEEELSELADRLAAKLPFTPDTILDALTTRLAS